MATAAVLLLLGCLNLASLALSRVSDRLEDLRVRNALGASRSRIGAPHGSPEGSPKT
jgi:HAMP domain-containing protein